MEKTAFTDDLDKLTEFRPLSPKEERGANTVLDFFSKLFIRQEPGPSNEDVNAKATSSSDSAPSEERKPENDNFTIPSVVSLQQNTAGGQQPAFASNARSLSIVTSRITTLLNLTSLTAPTVSTATAGAAGGTNSSNTVNADSPQQQLLEYERSDLRQYWMPDSRCKECYECREKFTTFRRRHHCRICGQIFCSKCCNQEIPGRLLGYVGSLRLCNYCSKAVVQYLKSPSGEQALSRKISLDFSGHDVSGSSSVSRKTSSAIMEVHDLQSSNVSTNREAMFDSTGASYFMAYPSNDSASAYSRCDRKHSVALTDRDGSVDPSTNYASNLSLACFAPDSLPSPVLSNDTRCLNLCHDKSDEYDGSKSFLVDEWEPDWVKNIVVPKNIGDYLANSENEPVTDKESKDSSVVDMSELPFATADERSLTSSSALFVQQQQQQQDFADSFVRVQWENSGASAPCPVLSSSNQTSASSHDALLLSFENEAKRLVNNLLSRECIPADKWFDVIWPLVREMAFTVQPDLKERKDDMSVLSYVHVKTVRASKPNAQVIFGTVCTKNLTDSRMKKSISNPKILIIGGSVEYERVEGKFCSIDPVILQENEYLRSIVHKIASRQPDVVIIEKSVARIAQEFLREAGISLICNVKSKVLRRIARCTQADIVYSIEGQIAKPNLGRCGFMRVEIVASSACHQNCISSETDGRNAKSLIFFEDCPPDLGCAIVLNGSKALELRRVKKIMKFIVSLLYSGKLEIAMLRALRIQSPTVEQRVKNFNTESPEGEIEQQQQKAGEIVCEICDYNSTMLSENNTVEPDVRDDESRRNFVDSVSTAVFHVSPFIRVYLPYLETKIGSLCRLRPFFNLEQLYRCSLHTMESKMFNHIERNNQDGIVGGDGCETLEHICTENINADKVSKDPCQEICVMDTIYNRKEGTKIETACVMKSVHSFFTQKITKSALTYDMKRDLANFRAQSGAFFRRRREEAKRQEYLARVFSSSTPELSIDEEGTDSVLDVLDPQTHQRLAVLYCSYMASPAHDKVLGFCLKPRVFVMHYYGQFDCTLGDYLERYCFSPTYKCANEACEGSMVGHIRKLVHGSSCVEISIQNLDTSNSNSNGRANDETTASLNQILTWDWCPNCKLTTSTNQMQKELWHLSFAKFLDYLFNGQRLYSQLMNETYCSCCSLHSHVHHFANKNLVVIINVSKISLHDVCFPALSKSSNSSNTIHSSPNFSMLVNELKTTGEKLIETLDTAAEVLSKLRMISETQYKNVAAWQTTVSELQTVYEEANTNFRLLVNEAQKALASVRKFGENRNELDSTESVDLQESWLDVCADKTHKSKCTLAHMVNRWNALTGELNSLNKKKLEDKQPSAAVVANTNFSPAPIKPLEDSSTPLAHVDPSTAGSSVASTLLIFEESSPLKRISTSSADLSNAALICDKKSLTKLLSSMYLPSPFELHEHFTLPPSLDGTSFLVRDTELGSVVAYTLASEEYERSRRMIIEGWSRNDVPFSLRSNACIHDSMQSSSAIPNTGSSADLAGDGNATTFSANSNISPHVEVQFSDATTKFYCKVYFAEHFRALRKLIFIPGERAFVTSLSRCESWTPKGGKSGAVFNRTADRCFVLKQISRFELQSFNKFAPRYFDYVSSACTENKLTALAKIFGIFRVGFNNTATSTATKMDFVVMEYLFCDREVDRVYDLKGSLRNRLAPIAAAATTATNASDESKLNNVEESVLLDVNLLRDICNNPFYMHPHAKAALNAAMNNDSFFLSSNHIMDYSLLCGIDRERKELVVGIIDYMRTYTWDKRVESWVKSTVTVTGHLPTVISPELYRNRFVEIMDVYFPLAPDQWTGLGYSNTA